MNSIKKHLALIIPLLALLFSLESIVSIDRIISEYEKGLTSSYSIVIASKDKIKADRIKSIIKETKSLESISTDIILDDLKDSISDEYIKLLEKELPYFYNINLDRYPSESRLKQIDSSLSKLNNVLHVESFAKSHSQTYEMLLILKSSITLFGSLIVVLSYLLMMKHIEVWRFEHLNRMEIMSFLGASYLMRNKPLFKLAIVDSIISSVIVFFAMLYLLKSSFLANIIKSIGVNVDNIIYAVDFAMLFGVGIIVSIVSVFMVIIKQKGR